MFSDRGDLQTVRKEMRLLSAESTSFSRAMGQTGKPMQLMSRQFASGMKQMQLQAQKLREELGKTSDEKLPSLAERIGTVADAWKDLTQQFSSLGSELTKLATGTTWAAMQDESKQAAKLRGQYDAKGKTDEEMKKFDELTDRLATVNPYLSRPQIMTLIDKSEMVNPQNAQKYAEAAAKLSVTTKFSPEELLKKMDDIRQKTGIDDVTRLANSIQYTNNHAGNLSDKHVEAIMAAGSKTGNLMNTPEKMATMIGEIGKLKFWNEEKSLHTLSQNTLKLDQASLNKLLIPPGKEGKEATAQAEKEAKALKEALQSGDQEKQRMALGKMMVSLAAQDQATQQKVLADLGGGSDLKHMLETAGEIAQGKEGKVHSSEGETAYQAARAANPYFDTMQTQAAARQEAMEALGNMAKDMAPLVKGLADAFTYTLEAFNAMPREGRALFTIAAGALGAAFALAKIPISVKVFRDALVGLPRGKTESTLAGGRQRKPKKFTVRSGVPGTDTGEQTTAGAKDKTKAPGVQTAGQDKTSTKSPQVHGVAANAGGTGFSALKGAKGLLRRLPMLGPVMGMAEWLQSNNKMEKAGQLGSEALGSWGGAAAGAAAGAAIGSVVPIIGTAAGGVIGGLIGGFGGSMLGSAAFDGIKSMFSREEKPSVTTTQALPSGPPVPGSSPAGEGPARPQNVTITVPQITIPLHADGVLQDIPTMLKMLGDPTVGQKIKSIIEKSLLDALETRGGVPV